MGHNITVLMGTGDGGRDDDPAVRICLARMRVMAMVEGEGNPLRVGPGGEAPFLGGGSGLERRRPPVQG